MSGDLRQGVDLDQVASWVKGALDVSVGPNGISLRRLPLWTKPQIPSVVLDAMVQMTSGVRLHLVTNSSTLTLTVQCGDFAIRGDQLRDPIFLASLDGREVEQPMSTPTRFIVDPTDPSFLDIVSGGAAQISFDKLGHHTKELEIWFPTGSSVEILSCAIDHGAEARPAGPRSRTWIHYGSSISHCREVGSPTSSWTQQCAQRAGVDLVNLGFAGQCHLDQFVARSIRDTPCDLVSLKLGANVVVSASMTARTFSAAVEGFIDTVRDGHPFTPLLLCSPIYSPLLDEHTGPLLPTGPHLYGRVTIDDASRLDLMSLAMAREVLFRIVSRRQSEGDEHIHYLSGTELLSSRDEALLHDGLHPTEQGYALVGNRFFEKCFSPDSTVTRWASATIA